VAHFKFLLDQSVIHLESLFPPKRVITLKSLGLAENTADAEIVEAASINNFLLVTSNRKDFLPLVRAYIAKSRKKEGGCQRVSGLILLVPNEQYAQKRVLQGVDNKLKLEGKKITFKDVHDRDLLVQIEASGAVRISRLPRCPHCIYHDEPKK
jgi:hypothetical protein